MARVGLGFLLALFLGQTIAARPALGVTSWSCPPPVAQKAPADALRAYIEACESFGFSGSVLVARGGKVLLAEGFGLADRDKQVENTPATCFEIASATKSFTAVAVLQLAQQGKLALDDSIAEHLPGVPKQMADITIRHLLNHTSGMPRSATGGRGDDLATAVAGYFSVPRTRKPGAEYEYWNGGYALLAGIVERASGVTYMEWCHAHIFEPAGMKSSGFTGDERFATAPMAIGYEADAKPRRADEHPYTSYGWHYRGMGGIVTTVEDMYGFDRALRGDALLGKRWRAELLKPALEKYACGFAVIDEPQRKIGHGGDVRGFHVQFQFFPADDAAIVVLCNVGGVPAWAVAENLQALLFGNPLRYPAPPATKASPDDLAALEGTFQASADEQIVVRMEGSALVLSAFGVDATRLLSAGAKKGWTRPEAARIESARKLVESVSRGDPEQLRRCIGSGISDRWPDRVVSTMWPKHIQDWGELKGVRVAGATASADTTTVLLALEHARGSPRLEIVFQGDRLRRFELAGPETLASARAVIMPKGQLARFAWTGAQPAPIEIVRGANRAPVALRLADQGRSQLFQRRKD